MSVNGRRVLWESRPGLAGQMERGEGGVLTVDECVALYAEVNNVTPVEARIRMMELIKSGEMPIVLVGAHEH